MENIKKVQIGILLLAMVVFNVTYSFAQACFSASSTKGCVPLKIVLKNCSSTTDPRLVLYDFGDGTGFKNVAEYTYLKAGKYFVTQLINGTPSSQSDGKYLIEVLAPETPQFSVDFCSDNAVNVKVTSNGMPEYIINYGDGKQDTVKGLTATSYLYKDSNPKTITVSGFVRGTGTCGDATQTITPRNNIVAATFNSVKVVDNNTIELNFVQDASNNYKVGELNQTTNVTRNLDISSGLTSLTLTGRNTLVDAFTYRINPFDKCKNTTVQALIAISTVNLQAVAQAKQNFLSWNSPITLGFVRYDIYRNNQLISTIKDLSQTSFFDTKIICNQSYTYRVETILHDEKSKSISANKTVVAVSASTPKAIENLTVSIQDAATVLKWKYATGDSAMTVLIKRTVNGGETKEITVNGNAKTYTDSEVRINEKSYCYAVSFIDICGKTSPVSNVCSILLTGEETDKAVNLTWSGSVNYPNAKIFLEKLSDTDTSVIAVNRTSFSDPKTSFTNPNVRYRIRIVTTEGVLYSNIFSVRLPSEFSIPTAFSPNGDGLNDVFKPVSSRFLTNYKMTIFSQWGTVIFESIDATVGWDGVTSSGVPAQSGTYVFQVEYNDSISRPIVQRGIVTLIR